MLDHTIITVLAFDFGMKSIGYAVGQRLTQTATPLNAMLAKQGVPDWTTLAAIISQWQPQGLVVGIPIDMYGQESQISMAARKFARRLQQRYRLPVYTIDEKLSTREAWTYLSESGRHPSKAEVDAYSAKIILQSWLNENG